ncbi:MAG: tetratricopeptide repeat protein, partial [Candidatus Eisenbacteria sp.]|nr:tetratricopeptide repeat protein [Candidatus Eisenbacteria bacterium]
EQGRSSGQESPSGPQEGALSDEEWTKQLEENEIYRSEHPDDPRPLYNLGNLYHLRGDFPQAQEFYEIGSGRAPGRLASQLAYNYGNNLHRQGNLLEAREVYAKALRLNQENEDAKLNLELTQLLLDQLSQMPDSSSQPGSCDQDSGDQKSDNQESGEDESPEDGSQGQEDSQPQERQEQSGEDSSEQDKQDEQDKQQDSSQQERGQEEYSQDQQDRRPDEEQDSQCDQESSDRSVAEPDSVVDLETMQLMQILKGLEATEKELLQKRFQARSRNTRVEKDW